VTKNTDIRVIAASLYFLPIKTRIPLKFGPETVTTVTCARVKMTIESKNGKYAVGWGETPLSIQWIWPSEIPYETRYAKVTSFTKKLTRAWSTFPYWGHPIEIGQAFQTDVLPELLKEENDGTPETHMPWLAALVSCSPFDIALHDAFGNSHGVPVYETYSSEYLNFDLAYYLTDSKGRKNRFEGRYPADYFVSPPDKLVAWHLVGGMDKLTHKEASPDDPKDGYPVVLTDWIKRDGLKCLKIKLRGNDAAWDYARIVQVGNIAIENDCHWLSADFNCTVRDPAYVNEILDRLLKEHPRIYGMLLYVEQPFPYDLENNLIDVHSVSARKPLFMDESAHDWRLVKLGRELGWSGVALKTCKTQTGALLTLSWAKAHGMTLMVQDLTNPMLAQIPHVQLARHAGTIMGVETNGMQFYPDASLPEATVHPGLYSRREGCLDLSTLKGSGFGYCLEKIPRVLPEPVAEWTT